MLGQIGFMMRCWFGRLNLAMGWTVKSLYGAVNRPENIGMSSLQEEHTTPNTTVARRKRVLQLLQTFVQEQTSQGVPPKGLEQAFAAKLQISPSRLSQIKNARPIGDKLARQIERMCDKPRNWLDAGDDASDQRAPHDPAPSTWNWMSTQEFIAYVGSTSPRIVFDGLWRITCQGAGMLFADGSRGKQHLEEALLALSHLGIERCTLEWQGLPQARKSSR